MAASVKGKFSVRFGYAIGKLRYPGTLYLFKETRVIEFFSTEPLLLPLLKKREKS